MNSSKTTQILKEQIIKLGTAYTPGDMPNSHFFFHKVPVPDILKNSQKKYIK